MKTEQDTWHIQILLKNVKCKHTKKEKYKWETFSQASRWLNVYWNQSLLLKVHGVLSCCTLRVEVRDTWYYIKTMYQCHLKLLYMDKT